MPASAPGGESSGKGPRCFSKSRSPRLSVGPPSGVRDVPPLCFLKFLGEPQRPPSQEEEEVPGAVGPELVSRVLASFGSLVKQLRVDLSTCWWTQSHRLFFLPWQGMDTEHQDCSPAFGSVSPPQASSSSSSAPLQPHLANGLASELTEAREADALMEDYGSWGAGSHGSTLGSGPMLVAEETWTTAAVLLHWVPDAVAAMTIMRGVLDWDPQWAALLSMQAAKLVFTLCRRVILGLEEELARALEAHTLEVRQLLPELEAQWKKMQRKQASPPPSVQLLPAPDNCGVLVEQNMAQGGEAAGAARSSMVAQGEVVLQAPRLTLSPAVNVKEDDNLHDVSIEPSPAAVNWGSRLKTAVRQPQNQDKGLRRFTRQVGGRWHIAPASPFPEGFLHGEEVQATIARMGIVVTEKPPTFFGAELRLPVGRRYSLQRGFSHMAGSSTVALVLGHFKGVPMHGEF